MNEGVFVVKANLNTYQDETNIKYSVIRVLPYDTTEESMSLIGMLNKYS